MTENKQTFEVRPIGRVNVDQGQGVFQLQINPPFRPGLEKLDQFSHVLIFWWADRNDTPEAREVVTVDLPYAPGEQAGVFSCRAEYRPNPIAVTAAAILHVDEAAGTVILPWIDALDGTPVVDLKPYLPCTDRIREVRVAPWMADWPVWMEDAGEYFAQHETDFGD
jgi:tRNA-Thr(GGU) m(6)t(6)A37 methyltransferase TsaA